VPRLRRPALRDAARGRHPGPCRAGFAGYFTNGFFDDHWVVEVWNDQRGWQLVDAQVASAPKGTYTNADVDPLDVPRGRVPRRRACLAGMPHRRP
jgi:hypothetical protein